MRPKQRREKSAIGSRQICQYENWAAANHNVCIFVSSCAPNPVPTSFGVMKKVVKRLRALVLTFSNVHQIGAWNIVNVLIDYGEVDYAATNRLWMTLVSGHC